MFQLFWSGRVRFAARNASQPKRIRDRGADWDPILVLGSFWDPQERYKLHGGGGRQGWKHLEALSEDSVKQKFVRAIDVNGPKRTDQYFLGSGFKRNQTRARVFGFHERAVR